MATIYFGVSGEGRGHATRVRAQVEALKAEHEISIFASGEAFKLLSAAYRGTDVEVRRIAGLRFHYTKDRRLAYGATARHAWGFLRRLPLLTSMIEERFEELPPDLVVTDFEPALPRVARRMDVPFVSVDHQHLLCACDLASLPWRLRLHALYMARIVGAYHRGQSETVVSSFYFPPIRRAWAGTKQVGVMLRPSVLAAEPAAGDYLVAYLRRFAGASVLGALAASGREVRVYGLGERPGTGRLSFRAIDEGRFLEDLAGCAALVSTAGNQLVGEALYLGKPVLALPEARNFEQYINAHFLARGGCGEWTELEKLNGERLCGFLDRLGPLRERIKVSRDRLHGLPPTLEVLGRYLPGPRRRPAPVPLFPLPA